MRLKNKVAIVTGAGSGFGEGIAKTYAREGARVMVADIGEAGGLRVVEDISFGLRKQRVGHGAGRRPVRILPVHICRKRAFLGESEILCDLGRYFGFHSSSADGP